jgi:hypothetical protein
MFETTMSTLYAVAGIYKMVGAFLVAYALLEARRY